MKAQDKVVVLDFGSQFTQLIARRVRESRIYSEIVPFDTPIEEIRKLNPKALILSGGPSSVYDDEAPIASQEIIDMDIPILGICYGMQLLGYYFGAKIKAAPKKEYGRAELTIVEDDALFDGFNGESIVWMSHADKIEELPQGFKKLGYTENSDFAAIRHIEKSIYGLQFHPEVAHTEKGSLIIENFVRKVSEIEGDWTTRVFVEESIKDIKKRVGNEKVLCAVSGGVDSTVMAVLLNRALGENVTCVFIDTGLLRLNEAEKTMKMFSEIDGMNVQLFERKENFYSALAGIGDPEAKRKAIGKTFIDVFNDIAAEFDEHKYLAQGTLYPDVIESNPVKGPSETIKSHHNVGGLPKDMKFELIEPFRELF